MEILKYKYYIPTLFRSMEFALYKMTWQIQKPTFFVIYFVPLPPLVSCDTLYRHRLELIHLKGKIVLKHFGRAFYHGKTCLKILKSENNI